MRNVSDTLWWTGSADVWTSSEFWLTATGTTSWTSSVPSWVTGKLYRIRANAVDNANNQESSGNGNLFTYDTVAPTAVFVSPINGAYINSLTYITGTSSDDKTGVNKVQLYIRNLTDTKYWDGGSWLLVMMKTGLMQQAQNHGVMAQSMLRIGQMGNGI